MNPVNIIYVSPIGGSIACLNGLTGRIFRTCFANKCSYSSNLHSAKSELCLLEKGNKLIGNQRNASPSEQRKTTLKWNPDGSLSSIDMTRILTNLEVPDLTACELACECDYS